MFLSSYFLFNLRNHVHVLPQKNTPMNSIRTFFILLVGLTAMVACKPDSKKQATTEEVVQQSIKRWIMNRTEEYPNYTPAGFEELTPRYRFNRRTHSIEIALNEENSKGNPNQNTIDSLKELLNKDSNDFLGYTIVHRFTTKGIDGEVKNQEMLFFIDPQYRVITALNSDAWDLIMDKELFFKPESPDSVK